MRALRLTSSDSSGTGTSAGRVGVLIVALLLSASIVTTAPAQSTSEQPYDRSQQSYQSQEQPSSGPAGTDVPDWAESDPVRSPSGESSAGGAGQAAANATGPPANPNRVPIGGLGWLIAAGLGYGSYRLGWAGDNRE